MAQAISVRVEEAGGIGLIRFAAPPVNAMVPGLPGALRRALAGAPGSGALAVLLLPGGSGTLAGADISMQGRPWPEAEPKVTDLIAAVDASPVPVAILLRGRTLGGGLEIAMACRWRLAVAGAAFGQPEVNLGIPPGAGGTQRLPRIAGVAAALDIIASGRTVAAEEALAIGLVDHILAQDDAEAEATGYLRAELAAGRIPEAVGARTVAPADPAVFEAARATARKRRRGEDAPLAAIDAVEAATRLPLAEGLAYERERFLACVSSPQAAAMRHVFFASRAARKGHVPPGTPPHPVARIGVLGAGTMGAGIAMTALAAGFDVRLADGSAQALAAARERIATFRERQPQAAQGGALTTGDSIEALADRDLIVEAVFEDMEVKRDVFARLAVLTPPGAILASNTSYLDLDHIAESAGGRAGDVVGLHFFSPAQVMPLLEIVRGRQTSDTALATALWLGERLGKTAIVAGPCHGFIANRSFARYTDEAEFLVLEGASPREVDAALTGFGMAMGPFAVRDLAGLDIGWARRKATAHLRSPGDRYSDIGERICERGWFGQKTGRGFYRYDGGARGGTEDPEILALIAEARRAAGITPRDIGAEEIVRRCLFAVVNEAALILEEGIARRASDIDLAWVAGYGFPRWRGGPLFWADTLGTGAVLDAVRGYPGCHPAPLLVRLAGAGQGFADHDRAAAG